MGVPHSAVQCVRSMVVLRETFMKILNLCCISYDNSRFMSELRYRPDEE